MAPRRSTYHHGDLRAALLRAGEAQLARTGVAGFSLRKVASRCGVSHAAPAHHFGDAEGLLAALAAEGFRRFLAAMQHRQANVGENAHALLVASGLGYLDFARSSPALFRLMFGEGRVGKQTEELSTAANSAFLHLAGDVERLLGVSPFEHPTAMARAMAVWSLVHGFASLLNSGHMRTVLAMPLEQQNQFFQVAFAPLLGPLDTNCSSASVKQTKCDSGPGA